MKSQQVSYCICGGSNISTIGTINFYSNILGILKLENKEYLQCDNCNDISYILGQGKTVTDEVKNLEQAEINKQPIENFICSSVAAQILGISKYTLAKDPRINKGMIMWVKIGDYRLYLRKSVEMYKKTGKGTYNLKGKE